MPQHASTKGVYQMSESRENELKTGSQHKCENTDGKPIVFAAGLSDEELADYLENLAIQIRARLRMKSMPEQHRREAEELEAKVTALNESIDSAVCRQNPDAIHHHDGVEKGMIVYQGDMKNATIVALLKGEDSLAPVSVDMILQDGC